MGTRKVRLVPALSAEALRRKEHKALETWYCLRALDHDGRGWLQRTSAIDGLVNEFHFSPRGAEYAIKRGMGIFWTASLVKGRTRINVQAVKGVAGYFRTATNLSRHFCEVPATSFDTPTLRTAQVYASVLPPGEIKSNPISRRTIKDWTGLTVTQQRRYERAAGIKPVPNYAVRFDEYKIGLDPNTHERVRLDADSPLGIPRKDVIPVKMEVRSGNKVYRLNKRLPNCYRTQQTASSRGMLKRAIRTVRRSSNVGEALPMVKRYFGSFRQAVRALARHSWPGDIAYNRLARNRRIIEGRMEWALCVS